MPSVIHTTSGISAAIASRMAAAASGGGTKITDAFAPVPFMHCRARAAHPRVSARTHSAPAQRPLHTHTRAHKHTHARARALTSATVAKMGKPRCVEPAFFGFVPPTIFVPYSIACWEWKVPCTHARTHARTRGRRANTAHNAPPRRRRARARTCFPVKPWHMTFVVLFTHTRGASDFAPPAKPRAPATARRANERARTE